MILEINHFLTGSWAGSLPRCCRRPIFFGIWGYRFCGRPQVALTYPFCHPERSEESCPVRMHFNQN